MGTIKNAFGVNSKFNLATPDCTLFANGVRVTDDRVPSKCIRDVINTSFTLYLLFSALKTHRKLVRKISSQKFLDPIT